MFSVKLYFFLSTTFIREKLFSAYTKYDTLWMFFFNDMYTGLIWMTKSTWVKEATELVRKFSVKIVKTTYKYFNGTRY